MQKFIFFFYLVFLSFGLFGQDLERLYQKGNFDKVIELGEKQLLQNTQNDITTTANLYSKITNAYRKKGNFEKAQKYAFQFLAICEKNNSEESTKNSVMAYNDLGAIFSDLSLKENAYKYFEKALQASRQVNDVISTGKLLNNLGEQYLGDNQAKKAQTYLQESLDIAYKIKDTSSIISRNTNLADAYIFEDIYEKALFHLEEAMFLAKKTNKNSKIPFVAFELARAYVYKPNPNFEKSLEYAQMAETFFKKQNASQYQMYIHQLLSEIYEKKGEGINALQEHKKFTQLKDSLTGLQVKNKLQTLEVQYETEKKDNKIKSLAQIDKIKTLEINQLNINSEKQKKETELEDLKQNKTIQTLKISELEKINQNNTLSKQNQDKNIEIQKKNIEIQQRNFGIIAIMLIGVFLSILGYLFYRQKRLTARNKNIELEQKLLRSQMNPHFIFNSLTNIQNFLFENETLQTAKYLAKLSKLMRQILENSREEFIYLDKEIQTLNNYLELQKLRFPEKFEYNIHVDKETDSESIKIPPMFAQPFIENSLEHGILHKTQKGFLQIDFKAHQDYICLDIQDNGVGIEIAKLFRSEEKKEYTSLATKITQERLDLFSQKFNKSFSFKILPLENGLLVQLKIPLLYA